MKALKNTIAAIAVASTAIVPMATSASYAHDRGFGHHHGNRGAHCGPRDRNCDGIRDRQVIKKRAIKKQRRGLSGGDAAAIAIIGAIGGAIIGSALQNNQPAQRFTGRPVPKPTYNDRNVFPPAPDKPHVVEYQSSHSLEPWSAGWYQYCDNRYRSFNPKTGTFRGYDGKDHFCVPK